MQTNSTEHRLTKLETQMWHMTAHSRRIADAEFRLHDMNITQLQNVSRLSSIEQDVRYTKTIINEEKLRRAQRRAMLQWGMSALMVVAVVGAVIRSGEVNLTLFGL